MSRPSWRAACALATSTLLLLPVAVQAGQGLYGPLALRPKDALIIEKSGELEELFRRRGNVLTEGPELELVRRVGAAVAPDPPSDPYVRYRFGVVRNPIPNAFALPDGQIYVHAGLLALLENEAQLASVLAHEAIHVEGHHSIVNARQARKKQGGMVALSVVLGQIGSLINIALAQAVVGYTRDLEQEADVRAIPLLLDAGYDPREMPRIFALLDEDPEGEQLPVKPAWADHPLGVQRAAYTEALLAEMAPEIEARETELGGLTIGAEGFADETARAANLSVEQILRADRPRTALALAERLAQRRPDDPDAHALVGDAWRVLDARTPRLGEDERSKKEIKERRKARVRHTREEREAIRRRDPAALPVLEHNWERAEEAYLDALDLDPDHPPALRGLGLLLLEQGELVESGRRLACYVQVAPDALDRPVILKTLTAITAELEAARTEASR